MTSPTGGRYSLDVQRVSFRSVARAALVRHRIPLILIAALLLAVAGGIYWLAKGVLVGGADPYVNVQQVLYIRILIFAAPPLIAALAGAPLLAAEYESGTFRFSHTQGAGRRRLLLATLLVYLVTILAASIVVALSISHFYRVLNHYQTLNPWKVQVFFSQPVMFVLLTVAAFSLSIVVGALLKKTVASITVTIGALFAGIALTYFEAYHWTLTLLARTAVTNDPAFTKLSTFQLFGATSAHQLSISSDVTGEWMENGRGQHVSSLMSPAHFELLHRTEHYSYWVQIVTEAQYHAAQLVWLSLFLVVILAALFSVFIRVGGRDRLFPAATRGVGQSVAAQQVLVHDKGERE